MGGQVKALIGIRRKGAETKKGTKTKVLRRGLSLNCLVFRGTDGPRLAQGEILSLLKTPAWSEFQKPRSGLSPETEEASSFTLSIFRVRM